MHKKSLLNVLLTAGMLLTSSASYAGFSTYTKNWPDDAETVNEKIATPEAPVVTYTEDTDKIEYAPAERIYENNRLYAKVGMTFFTAQIRGMTNVSQPALSSATLLNTDASEDYFSWEVGLGTKLKYVRVEAEYLYQKDLPYNATPLFANRSENVTSYLNTQAAWLTMLYDMDKLNLPYFTPYIGASAGFVWNKTRTTMYGGTGDGAAQNHSRYALGWGVTFGIRMPFWTRWFGYLGYKYMDQGSVRFQSSTGVMEIKGHSVIQGVDLGIQYLLG